MEVEKPSKRDIEEAWKSIEDAVTRKYPRLAGTERSEALKAEARSQVRSMRKQTVVLRMHSVGLRSYQLLFLSPTILLLRFVLAVKSVKRPQSLPQALMSLTDWVPFPSIRKRQRKLIADEVAEIAQFRKEKRHRLARWRSGCLLWNWCQYLLTGPVTAFIKAFFTSAS